MPGYLPSELTDLVNSTLTGWDAPKIEDIALPLQEYYAAPRLLKHAKEETGSSLSWAVHVSQGGNYADTGLYAVENVNVAQTSATASIPWTMQYWAWAIDEREVAMNAGDTRKIFDIAKEHQLAEYQNYVTATEDRFWSKPADTTDNQRWYGIYMYIVKNATEGFNGGNPSGFTSGVGLNSSTYTTWVNWTRQYTTIPGAGNDFLHGLRTAIDKTNFKPVMQAQAAVSEGPQREIFTNYSVKSDLEDLVESRNQNLGRDLTYINDDLMVRRIPIRWVPQLDADTTNPVIGIDWGTIQFRFVTGFRDRKITEKAPYQSLVTNYKHHSMMNMRCVNRRRNFIMYV